MIYIIVIAILVRVFFGGRERPCSILFFVRLFYVRDWLLAVVGIERGSILFLPPRVRASVSLPAFRNSQSTKYSRYDKK